MTPEPYESCNHFETCQVNDCPLARKPNLYLTLPEDKLLFGYHKCKSTKKTRMKIAQRFNLTSMGLTLRELAGMRQSIKLKVYPFSTQEKQVETPESSINLETSEVGT